MLKSISLVVTCVVVAGTANATIISGDYLIDASDPGIIASPSGVFVTDVPLAPDAILHDIAPLLGGGTDVGTANFLFDAGTSILVLGVDDFGLLGFDLGDLTWDFTSLVIPGEVIGGISQIGGPAALSLSFGADSLSITTADFGSGVETFTFEITTVPEPSSFAILLIGGVGFGWHRRRRLSQQHSATAV